MLEGLPGASHSRRDGAGYLELPEMKAMAFIDRRIPNGRRAMAIAVRDEDEGRKAAIAPAYL